MALATSLGHRDQRAKRGPESYYKGRYYIAFYKVEGDDEAFYAGFDNVADICRYLGWGVTPSSMNRAHQTLYKCLHSECGPYTKLIDGVKLKLCLIDMSEDE